MRGLGVGARASLITSFGIDSPVIPLMKRLASPTLSTTLVFPFAKVIRTVSYTGVVGSALNVIGPGGGGPVEDFP